MTTCQNCGTYLPDDHALIPANSVWEAIKSHSMFYKLIQKTPLGITAKINGVEYAVVPVGASQRSNPNGYDGDWDQGHEEEVWVALEVNGQAYLLTGTMNSYGDDAWEGVRLAKAVTKTVTVWE